MENRSIYERNHGAYAYSVNRNLTEGGGVFGIIFEISVKK